MNIAHETILDDHLSQLYFSYVTASDELLPAHWHEHLEILYITEGKLTAYINDASYPLGPGDVFLVNPRDIHYTHAHRDCRYCLLQIPEIHLQRISGEWEALHFTEYLPCSQGPDSLNRRLAAIFQEMNRLYGEKTDGYQLLFLSQLYLLLYLLYKEDSRIVRPGGSGHTRRDLARMKQCMEYVRTHYQESITLADGARLLSVTPEHFCRLFKKYTGQTFYTYVNQVRLMHFYQDLLQTNDSITFLLDKNGITNYKVFLRDFKEAYGTTPHRLRQERR